MSSIAKSLNRFNQGIMVGFGSLFSFSMLMYIIDDNYNYQKKLLIKHYETEISNYKNQIDILKESNYKLANKSELK